MEANGQMFVLLKAPEKQHLKNLNGDFFLKATSPSERRTDPCCVRISLLMTEANRSATAAASHIGISLREQMTGAEPEQKQAPAVTMQCE